jgi:hypothetical protein
MDSDDDTTIAATTNPFDDDDDNNNGFAINVQSSNLADLDVSPLEQPALADDDDDDDLDAAPDWLELAPPPNATTTTTTTTKDNSDSDNDIDDKILPRKNIENTAISTTSTSATTTSTTTTTTTPSTKQTDNDNDDDDEADVTLMTAEDGLYVCTGCEKCATFVASPIDKSVCSDCGCSLLHHLADEDDYDFSDDDAAFEFDEREAIEDLGGDNDLDDALADDIDDETDDN